MKQKPPITVRLVHIDGPFRGNIDEFQDSHLTIGRHPSCNICFPRDQTLISRMHADLVREGNRFKIIDRSTNGTFVNGKKVGEAFLKDGDVIIIGQGGPKISFLTETGDPVQPPSAPPSDQTLVEHFRQPSPPRRPESSPAPLDAGPAIKPAPPEEQPRPAAAGGGEGQIQTVQVPLVIQYGPTIQSYRQLPVAIGKSVQCEFVIDHPNIIDQHILFFFDRDHYWVKDLTGRQILSINGSPVEGQAPLAPNDRLALSANGPNFRFLGGGRLAEIEEPATEQPPSDLPSDRPDQKHRTGKGLRGAKAIFDKFLRR